MARRSWTRVLAPTWILVAVFLLSLPAVTTRIYASDEVEYFSWLHSLVFDHDVSFNNEYQYFYDSGQVKNAGFHATFLEETNEAGHRRNFTPIGSAVLWAPFYAAGHVVALLSGAPADGLSHPYIAAIAYGSAVYGLFAVLLSAAIARRVVGTGMLASVIVWAGTPLVYYMYITPPFSHAASAFAVALFLWVWLRARETWSLKGAVALGITGALVAMVREQDAFFIAGPALDFLWTLGSGLRATGSGRRVGQTPAAQGLTAPPRAKVPLAAAVAGPAAFFVAYLPQILAYLALNGHIGPDETVRHKMTWTAPHAWQVLLSAEHGLFAWTPLALIGLAGLVALSVDRRRPNGPDVSRIAVCALVMFGLQVYIAGSVESWTVAGSFGQRRFVSTTPLFVLGLAYLFARLPAARAWWRATLVGLVTLCIWWNLGLMAQFGTNTMDRQRLTLRDNAWRTYAELPREAPALVWRYLTNRQSFYSRTRS